MNCKELVELVTDYLEGKLPLTEQQQFEAHLSGCVGCRNYLDQMQTTIRLAGRLTEDHIPVDGRDKLLQAFRQWKANPK